MTIWNKVFLLPRGWSLEIVINKRIIFWLAWVNLGDFKGLICNFLWFGFFLTKEQVYG